MIDAVEPLSTNIINIQANPPMKLKKIIDLNTLNSVLNVKLVVSHHLRPIFINKTPANNSAGTSMRPEMPKLRKGSPAKLVAFIVNP